LKADLLVAPAALAAHLDDPRWVVFDTRHELSDHEAGPHAYAGGHIPGAYFLHVDDDLSAPLTGTNGRHPLPDPAVFATKVNACGVGPDTRVVVYDDTGGTYALRLWWMLRWLGHENAAGSGSGWRPLVPVSGAERSSSTCRKYAPGMWPPA